jgi:DDE superfamily endonuclease
MRVGLDREGRVCPVGHGGCGLDLGEDLLGRPYSAAGRCLSGRAGPQQPDSSQCAVPVSPARRSGQVDKLRIGDLRARRQVGLDRAVDPCLVGLRGLPEPLDWQKEFNTQINKIRYIIEQAIANFKTWRIMHTDYRRPLATLPQTISAAVALHFYAVA